MKVRVNASASRASVRSSPRSAHSSSSSTRSQHGSSYLSARALQSRQFSSAAASNKAPAQSASSSRSAASGKPTKAKQLRELISGKDMSFIMEAHSGLSAKIVEETGFKGIWASGLSISAQLGVRDSNEASWTQVLEVLEYMSDATSIPILVDADTGYGNFNNARRLVKKLEQRSIAGLCIEDKLFPKTNSLLEGLPQPLADIGEFCGKLQAIKDTQSDPDFVVVARVEALIARQGHAEAIKRADAYRKAGADAILIHSNKSTSQEIDAFMKEWAGRHPVVIVPTKYHTTPTQHFKDIGVNMIIWANHNLRASVKAMKETSKKIYDEQNLHKVEKEIVSVNEIFRLTSMDELNTAEKKYLPQGDK